MSSQAKDVYGECQLEVDFLDEGDLRERFHSCKKNPKHKNFFSLKSLNLDDLPECHRTYCAFHYIRHIAQFTVNLTVDFISPDRPCTCGNEHLSEGGQSECLRGNLRHVGSGFVTGLADPDQLKPDVIDATKTYFILVTAAHVIFDTSEAQKTEIEFFYDDPDDRSLVRTARGVEVLNTNFEADFSEVLCVTEEKEIAEILNKPKFTIPNNLRDDLFLKEVLDKVVYAIEHKFDEACRSFLTIMKEEGYYELIDCLKELIPLHRSYKDMNDVYLQMERQLDNINGMIPATLPPLSPLPPLCYVPLLFTEGNELIPRPRPLLLNLDDKRGEFFIINKFLHAIRNKYDEACESLLTVMKQKGHGELIDRIREFVPRQRNYKRMFQAHMIMERILEKIYKLNLPLISHPVSLTIDKESYEYYEDFDRLLKDMENKEHLKIIVCMLEFIQLHRHYKHRQNAYLKEKINFKKQNKPILKTFHPRVMECSQLLKLKDIYYGKLDPFNQTIFSDVKLEFTVEEEVSEDLVFHISHPHGTSKKVTFGNVVTADTRHGHYQLIYSLDTCKGSSGGPVFVIPSSIYSRDLICYRSSFYADDKRSYVFQHHPPESISCVPHARHHGDKLNSSSSWTEYL